MQEHSGHVLKVLGLLDSRDPEHSCWRLGRVGWHRVVHRLCIVLHIKDIVLCSICVVLVLAGHTPGGPAGPAHCRARCRLRCGFYARSTGHWVQSTGRGALGSLLLVLWLHAGDAGCRYWDAGLEVLGSLLLCLRPALAVLGMLGCRVSRPRRLQGQITGLGHWCGVGLLCLVALRCWYSGQPVCGVLMDGGELPQELSVP